MNPEGIIRHVRNYPRWYAAAIIWLVMMVFLPVVGVDIIPAFAAPASQQQPSTTEAGTPPTAAEIAAPAPALPSDGGSSPTTTPVAPTPTDPPGATESTPPEIIPPEELPPDFFDPVFDAIPGLPAVDTPEELLPVLRAVAPIANYGCSATGLAALVLAVVAPSVDGVPLERVIPYLGPVTTACANFPIPATHTECELDKPFIIDLGGLAKTPPVIGVGIDVIEAMEAEMIAAFGADIPRFSASLRDTLDCEVVTT
ncbi:hypothetical protein [Actinospongicola halichondriae]|uniref:hypothetical protein n=1 Tax=Actinospongicola halichondriae TaxID=3236844 RepID=UPI003D54DD8B